MFYSANYCSKKQVKHHDSQPRLVTYVIDTVGVSGRELDIVALRPNDVTSARSLRSGMRCRFVVHLNLFQFSKHMNKLSYRFMTLIWWPSSRHSITSAYTGVMFHITWWMFWSPVTPEGNIQLIYLINTPLCSPDMPDFVCLHFLLGRLWTVGASEQFCWRTLLFWAVVPKQLTKKC